MARVLITGSSDGLGLGAAKLLAQGHYHVVLHARNEARAADVLRALPEAAGVVVGDLTTMAGIARSLRRPTGSAGSIRSSTTPPSVPVNFAGS